MAGVHHNNSMAVLIAVDLLEESNFWKKEFLDGTYEEPYFLVEYRQNRNSDLWRSTRVVEKMCEYILFLENKIGILEK
jgi:hypothetical protein